MKKNNQHFPWVFAFLALLFNPIIKIHLPKGLWAVIDICSGILILSMKSKITEASSESP
jgi:hypothetical protein